MHVLDCQGLETVCSLITPEVITFPAQLSMSFTRPLENKGFDLIMATFQKLIIVNVSITLGARDFSSAVSAAREKNLWYPGYVSIGLKGIINHV